MSEELKPCPFCGGKRVRYVLVAIKYERDEYGRVKCDDCLAYGPAIALLYGADRDAKRRTAVDEWNTRPLEENQS